VEDLDGKVAVVTGGAGGIGLALSRRFGEAGMKLVVADIEEEALAASAEVLRSEGHHVTTVVTDVSDGVQVDALATTAFDEHGAVHVLCNNAGVGGGGPMSELDESHWSWLLGVNLWGVIHGIRAFLPRMIEQGEGHIVNTASVAGLFSAPFMGAYNASKAAVVAISESLFQEQQLMGTGIGVSVLCPAWVRTRIHESERNRPTEPLAVPRDWDGGELSFVAQLIEAGMDPAHVADHVHDAVLAERFYILTHPETSEVVGLRASAIVDGGNPPFVIPQ
jgi:NAD(P)-dependent dehydrogenase (short-subunit alcohol dehydrogenase family)